MAGSYPANVKNPRRYGYLLLTSGWMMGNDVGISCEYRGWTECWHSFLHGLYTQTWGTRFIPNLGWVETNPLVLCYGKLTRTSKRLHFWWTIKD